MSHSIKVAALQLIGDNDKHKSIKKTEKWIAEYATKGAQLIVLEELHSTLYFCQTEDLNAFDLAEPIPGPTTQALSKIAKKYNVVIVGSIFEKRMPGIYHNTAVVFESNGEIAGMYRKMHIPDDPAFYEKFYFTPGDNDNTSGFKPIKTSVGALGVLVCWDQWYPEAARLMALAGAEILIYPTAIGWDKHDTPEEQRGQLDAWVTVQRGHAVANHLPVIAANRTGFEADPSGCTSGIEFWGSSFICGQQGEFLAQASSNEETGLLATLDKSRTESLRKIWPFFRDRRIDAYQHITKRAI